MRMTYPTAIVLQSVAQGVQHGFDIIDVSGLGAGTVYPILRRLEEARLVNSTWERATEARAEGRPPRRNYVITAAGRRSLAEALARYPGVARVLEPGPGTSPASA
jgi:PadR family transcriptional regulator, regulatory protein PadR